MVVDSNSSSETRSVVHLCSHIPNIFWEFKDTIFSLILVAIASIASPIVIILNMLVIIAVKQKKQLQKCSNFLLVSLAIADLLIGAISMPLFAVVEILMVCQVSIEHICLLDSVHFHLLSIFSLSSIYHLTFIAWERYVAVRKWRDYKVIVTQNLVKILAIIAWLVAIFTVVPLFTLTVIDVDKKIVGKWFVVKSVWVAFCLMVIVFFYAMVYLGLRKNNTNEINKVTTLIMVKLESKAAKMTGLVTAALTFSFVPVIVTVIAADVTPAVRTRLAFRLAGVLGQLNSVVNPLIYFYTNRRLREAVLELLKIRKPHAVEPSVGFHRRQDPFGSPEHVSVHHQIEERRSHLPRSASFDTALVLVFPHLAEDGKIKLKRSLSAPSGKDISSFCEDSWRKQRSATLRPTSTYNVESRRCQMKKECHKLRSAHVIELETENKHTTLTRPTSCVPAVVSDCGCRKPHDILTFKRPMPQPLPGKDTGVIDGLKLQQPSPTLRLITTTAELHAESLGRRRLSNSSSGLPTDRNQGTTCSTRKGPRSKSWDAATSVTSISRCQSF